MSKQNTFLGKEKILRILSKPEAKVHFVGVGGAGMSSLFCLTRHFGIMASGSDAKVGDFINSALAMGEEVYVGERADIARMADIVVYTLAVGDDNKEVAAAEEQGIPLVSRADYMSALAACYAKTVAVSGSHGKSTVTAMLYSILKEDLREPTVVCGAEFLTATQRIQRVGIGSLDYLVYESCEYKDSFLAFRPNVALFLNLELDHTDYFKDIEQIKKSFEKAMNNTSLALINGDDGNLSVIPTGRGVRRVTFGKGETCDYRYAVKGLVGGAPCFSFYHRGEMLGDVQLCCIGKFNAANAAAAICCSMEMGITFDVCKRGLEGFLGVRRRLEKIGKWCEREIYYDYAHHPTEIRAVIEAVKDMGYKEVTVIFCAHTYSRTEDLLPDFLRSLRLADYRILTEIDAVREARGNISSADFATACGGLLVRYENELLSALDNSRGPILLMGAGDNEWVKKILSKS